MALPSRLLHAQVNTPCRSYDRLQPTTSDLVDDMADATELSPVNTSCQSSNQLRSTVTDLIDDMAEAAELSPEDVQSDDDPVVTHGSFTVGNPQPMCGRPPPSTHSVGVRQPTNKPPVVEWTTIRSCEHDGFRIFPGMCIALKDGIFLRVTDILRNKKTNAIDLKGRKFSPLSSMETAGPFDSKPNELGWHQEIEKHDGVITKRRTLVRVPLDQAVRRRKLILSNRPFPAYSTYPTEECEDVDQPIEAEGYLVCRWKITRWRCTSGPKMSKTLEITVKVLRQDEADSGYSTSDQELNYNWRGPTLKGGSGRNPTQEEKDQAAWERLCANEATSQAVNDVIDLDADGLDSLVLDLTIDGRQRSSRASSVSTLGKNRSATPVSISDDEDDRTMVPIKDRRYTSFDGFSGCGGTSRGMRGAGLHIVAAFDSCPKAAASYKSSFPYVDMKCMDVFDYIHGGDSNRPIDIAHYSPPCQPWSPAHTRPGQNDERNEASSFCIASLLRKDKPRIVTMENSCGLFERHREFLYMILRQFTTVGYSIRFAPLKLAGYGVPQTRKRLIVIASW